MSVLVGQLRKEHVVLLEGLNQAYALGISSEDGREKLRGMRALLLAHLAKEDKELYPLLDAAALHNKRLASLLLTLRDEMGLISREALQFFTTYEHGGAGFEFARDFGRLLAALTARIRREETLLFPEYERASRTLA